MLDPNLYYVIAGHTVVATVRVLQGSFLNEDLNAVDAQELVHKMGYRGIEVVYRRMVASEDWLLRYDSSFDAFAPIALAPSYEEAQEKAKDWVSEDTQHRYAFVRASTLGDAIGSVLEQE